MKNNISPFGDEDWEENLDRFLCIKNYLHLDIVCIFKKDDLYSYETKDGLFRIYDKHNLSRWFSVINNDMTYRGNIYPNVHEFFDISDFDTDELVKMKAYRNYRKEQFYTDH
jgi:hypothetical protein